MQFKLATEGKSIHWLSKTSFIEISESFCVEYFESIFQSAASGVSIEGLQVN